MSLGELLGRCAACCICALEEREIGRWRCLEMARWWEQVRWVQARLMVRIDPEGSRLIDEDMIRGEKKDAVF